MMKNNRGIALASLVITVVVMLTITGTIVYNSTDTIKLRKLDDMYSDIILLNQKVTNYFLENNSLPTLGSAIHKNVISDTISVLNPNDGSYYYVIDLTQLNGVMLKYGEDYNKYNSDSNKNNVYIINESSHTIYYLKGIEINGVKKHSLDEDNSAIGNEEIPTPDGFYYVGGDKHTGYVISDNVNDRNVGLTANLSGNQFVWIPVDDYENFKRYSWIAENIITKPNEDDTYTEADDSLENGTDESKAMYKSVKLYGGFYIARYEAGYEQNGEVLKTTSKNIENIYGNTSAINWGTAGNDENPGTGAVTLARRNVC